MLHKGYLIDHLSIIATAELQVEYWNYTALVGYSGLVKFSCTDVYAENNKLEVKFISPKELRRLKKSYESAGLSLPIGPSEGPTRSLTDQLAEEGEGEHEG